MKDLNGETGIYHTPFLYQSTPCSTLVGSYAPYRSSFNQLLLALNCPNDLREQLGGVTLLPRSSEYSKPIKALPLYLSTVSCICATRFTSSSKPGGTGSPGVIFMLPLFALRRNAGSDTNCRAFTAKNNSNSKERSCLTAHTQAPTLATEPKINGNILVVWLRICDANCTFTAANIEAYKTQSDVGVLKNSALSGYSTNEHYTVLECNVLML
uniref:Uncharacterized protein n=1 Tax=Glossina palpalis gambiensis TaxID=67801 RepID=A0A1B0B108_9MUSC